MNIRQQFLRGTYASVPVILGFIPVGIAYAIMARQAGFSVAETCLMSLSVFAGASQMMVTGMYAEGASVIVMILATFVLNLRHLIMSVCVGRGMKGGGTLSRLLLGFGVTDESFAIFTTEKEENRTVPFFAAIVVVTYLSWNVGTLIGAFASDVLPEIVSASFGIALYAMFIGLLIPSLKGNASLALLAVIAAVLNAVLSQVVDGSISLVISALVCAFIGVFFVDDKEAPDDTN